MTTPIMLLVLVLAFLYNTGGRLRLGTYAVIIALNAIMLGTGYLGEVGTISKNMGFGVGFAAFFAMYYYIYATFLKGKYKSLTIVYYIGHSLFCGVCMVYCI